MSRNKDDFYGEFYEDEENLEDYHRLLASQKRSRKQIKVKDAQNEVGVCPDLTPEIYEEREKCRNDFVYMHQKIYPNSTGQKPFSDRQEQSTRFDQHIMQRGGRLLKLEPRGFAKTSRLANEALVTALEGDQPYILIVCSEMGKAEEVMDSIKTELMTNDMLEYLYPAIIACFRHLDEKGQKARYQTYGGELTYIHYGMDKLRFPTIPGEKCAGSIIQVKPLSNLKGLFHKVKSGQDAGKILRPTLVIFDDPQTQKDAASPSTVKAIIADIKRSALRGGSHSRRVSAIMAITPVMPGDVAYHFEKNEPSWELVRYPMIVDFPTNHDQWMNEYAAIYSNFDKTIRGDRERAQLEAKAYVEKHYDELHEGSAITWEWAYGWGEDPQVECSALQHAYNMILDDGWEDFQYEGQCNTEYGDYDEDATVHSNVATIKNKFHDNKNLVRNVVPQDTEVMVAHIDVNKEILTYAVMSSPRIIRPHIPDYGSYPKQIGPITKRRVGQPLRSIYNNPDFREVIYLGVKDLIEYLSQKEYRREDGVIKKIDKIAVDIRYEENYTRRACRESAFSSLVIPFSGVYVDPDDEPLHLRGYPDGTFKYNNCVEKPNKDGMSVTLLCDTAYMKTEVHKGFNLPVGVKGSITLWNDEQNPDIHTWLAESCNTEKPMDKIGKKTQRHRIVWYEKMSHPDNEALDNLAGCMGMLFRMGCTQDTTHKTKTQKVLSMSDYINQQKEKSIY